MPVKMGHCTLAPYHHNLTSSCQRSFKVTVPTRIQCRRDARRPGAGSHVVCSVPRRRTVTENNTVLPEVKVTVRRTGKNVVLPD